MMGTNDSWMFPVRDVTNMNPPFLHATPPRGGGVEIFWPWTGHEFIPMGGSLANFGLPGLIYTKYGQATPRRNVPTMKPSPHAIPPRGLP